MTNIPITFTKCFYKKNITSLLDSNSNFHKIDSLDKNFEAYEYLFDNTEKFNISDLKSNNTYSVFKKAAVYVYENSYIFISTEYDTTVSEDNISKLGKTIFRVCHNTSGVFFPENEIIHEIFNEMDSESVILFLQPDGYTIKRYEYKKDEFENYITCENENNVKVFSFVFYNCILSDSIDNYSKEFIQVLKSSAYCNSGSYGDYRDITATKVNNNYTILPSRCGLGLLITNKEKYKPETVKKFYLKYLESLKTIIHFEIKSKEFNKEIDEGKYKNLDELNKSVRKEMRNAVHAGYDIKNSLYMNDQVNLFYGKFLTSIDFIETLSGFIEICRSIEKEIRAEIDKREEEHDKRFDKILSLVAVFAIVSVFKDGSDLILSFIDAIKSKCFDASNIISLVSPLLSIIVIIILIRIFNNKK